MASIGILYMAVLKGAIWGFQEEFWGLNSPHAYMLQWEALALSVLVEPAAACKGPHKHGRKPNSWVEKSRPSPPCGP
ncbi:hypothetical protein LBMAG46_36660 [Planctomycetia bacterium]|nr:hypothetical protein LBMAG46_36660 [Planctomycetia bacterium]